MDFFNSPQMPGFVGSSFLSIYNPLEVANLSTESRPFFDIFYWISFTFWPALGMLFVHIYHLSGIEVKGLLALQAGLISPLILKGLITSRLYHENLLKHLLKPDINAS